MTFQTTSGFLAVISLGHLPIGMIFTVALALIFRHHLMKVLVLGLAFLLTLTPVDKQKQVLRAVKILQPKSREKDHQCNKKPDH